ncbi:MAG: hypothetical protein ACYCQI_11855 [Gammaproteobacteria bacterium]
MAASGNKKLAENKEIIHIGNVKHPLFEGGFHPLVNLINEYSGVKTHPAHPAAWLSFFSSSSLREEILLLARYAGPLKTVEAHVRKAHERKEAHLPDTLVQATVQAIQDGDVNLIDDNNKVIYEGMAERLMKLCKDLYKDRFAECLEQVRRAIPVESKAQQEERERINQDAIRQLFNALKKNDKDTAEAIKTFKAWAKTTSVINRIHLIYLALVELAEKGGELQGGWYGSLGDRWCYEVIGGILQRENLSPRMQQVLEFGVYYLFNPSAYLHNKKELVRATDFDSAVFIGSGHREIGVSDFCDASGAAAGARRDAARFRRRSFQNLLRAITTAYNRYCTATELSTIELVSDDVEIRRSPAASAAAQ